MNKNLNHAKDLRRNQTDAEKFLWEKLRSRTLDGFKFRRQVPLGSYILDFVCFEGRLIIELDGGQHAEIASQTYDAERDNWLRSQGFRIVRFGITRYSPNGMPLKSICGDYCERLDISS